MSDTKTAVVTGASRGIGQGIAVALAETGHRVYCVSTTAGGCDATVALCDAATGSGEVGAVAVVGNVADADSVESLAKLVQENHGHLDVLVNNAGITRDGLFARMSEEDFDAVISVNLRGTFLTCKAFARGMLKARGGRIVNIGSVVGVMGNAGQANYAASKAGLIGLTKSLAKEFGGRGVTVNLIAPGFITTDMTAALSDDVQQTIQKMIPLGRFGSAKDVAAAVQFLCSDAAAYITGQVLKVDGGMAM